MREPIELAPRVHRLPLLPREGVNAHLLGDVVVDAGPPWSSRRLLAALAGRAVAVHVLTHAHPDHQGGSAATDVMAFLKAFFGGRFFPRDTIAELQRWNRIYFPGQFDFGVGLERQWVPWILSPFRSVGDLLGFWGQSGAFAFHDPQHDLDFTGTVNRLSGFGHGAAVNAMLRVIRATR